MRRLSTGVRVAFFLYLVIFAFLVSLLSGCAPARPYATAALTYSFPFSTDYWQHADRPWQCEPPGFDLEAGYEWPNGYAAALYHESFVLCGSWNRKPEIYENGFRLSKKWGGL